MPRHFLLMDFGASHTKTALVDMNSAAIDRVKQHASLANRASHAGYYEIALEDLHRQFTSICADYETDGFDGIVICSQMHGFVLLDEQNRPQSPYVSWRDERSLESIDGISTFDLVMAEVGQEFQSITGMLPRPGLPFMNALHILRQRKTPASNLVKMISLPEWLALCHHDGCAMSHPTIVCGLGFHDVQSGQVSQRLVSFFEKHAKARIRFNDAASTLSVAGYYHSATKKIPINSGVGDLQCALLGAGIRAGVTSVNIGTGSQVSQLNANCDVPLERRPFFNHDYLLTQTHIPAGRALNEYMSFLAEVSQHFSGQEVDVWPLLASLTAEDILASDLQVNLGVFKGAYGYEHGGFIGYIHEGKLTLKNYCASILKSLLLQYYEVATKMGAGSEYVFSGGIAKKLPVLKEVFAKLTGANVVLSNVAIDETLLGLRILAFYIDQQHNDYTQSVLCISTLSKDRG